ncbi:hypothetical protein [Acidovorax facilis]|uniref:hypothetical protein n=1 Tax=Acidovorax facilis TaxID=12917 RepID=UPI003D65ED95
MTEQTQPTDAELLAFATEEQFLLFCDPDEFTDIARSVLAKWGTPAGAVEPVGEVESSLRFTGGFHARLYRDAHMPEPGTKLYTTPQPTQAQDETPCRKNPFYHGPRNCSRGTVGCCEDHGANSQAQAGAVPLTSEQERAIREAYESAGSESYFGARPQIDTNDRRRVFKAGFERGWDAKTGADHG